ncbi:MAG TPA: single-stranded-DNA-specific exonuclease RecJ, partial [Paracoccaceae bacterium]|nr:single-stranded-DNA-specific exonuclease RecJ [Paracoccaceae bacterium]
GRRWRLLPADERVSRALGQRHGLPEVVARILAARGVGLEEAEAHLNPSLRTAMPDPSSLRDMDKAADRIARAVIEGEPIAIFGDYDVDGATSAALLRRFLKAVGSDARIYIPDRLAEGYGPNSDALRLLKEEGARLVVLVDCGTTAHEPLEAAAAMGLDAVVIDHHAAEARLPPALALVNPNRLDETGALRQLAACGVTFLLLVALNRALRRLGFYDGTGRAEPDLLALLDLVALGTICDVVPLVGLNRALVAQGLKMMARRSNAGLAALADCCRIDRKMDAYHAAFLLGPRINAGGRIGRADLGALLLSTDDPLEAAEIAGRLDAHNQDRKEVEAAVLADAILQAEAAPKDDPILLVAGANWHPGVIGIVAGRLKERFNRPACVVAMENGIGKGSGRSMPGIDLGGAVIEARHAGLLLTGGGHPMAAGFTVAEDGLESLRAFLRDRIATAAGGGPIAAPDMDLDGTLSVAGATPDLANWIGRLGPFGAGNPEPRFLIKGARIIQPRIVGERHVSCFLQGADGARLRAIAFRAMDDALGHGLLTAQGTPWTLVGIVRRDEWNGQVRCQLHIEDASPDWRG